MTNLTRVTGKTFGETATATGDDPEIGQFGSAKAGTYVGTTDVATIQSLSAWSNGFVDSVTPNTQFPPLPEVTGALKVLSHQENYILQKGVAEWDSGTTYYTGDFCKGVGEGKLYVSKADSNINHAVTDGDYWEEFSSGASRNIGEIVSSTIPLTDAGLHLLDGSLLQYGSYQAFIDYIADLYDSGDYTAIFDTEANWQSAVTTYGVCGKFVYDSVNNTVRLPKITGIIEGGETSNIGDLTVAGLPNITGSVYAAGSSAAGGYQAPTGAFYTSSGGVNSYGSGTYNMGMANIDASRSSTIYGNSDTVQPQSIKTLYYIVIATSTKTQIQVDIDEIATDLNGKMDVDGTNAASSVKFADGQWVQSSHILGTSTAINSYSCDISSFLPADNYKYEVMINVYMYCNNSNATSKLRLSSDIWAELNNDANSAQAVVGGYGRQNSNTFNIPVGAGRTINYRIFDAAANTTIVEMWGYRRIGTNQ